MTAERVRQRGRQSALSRAWCLLALLLAGCSSVADPVLVARRGAAPDPGSDVVVLRTLAQPPAAVEACLRDNARRISYPRGIGPTAMTAHPDGDGTVLEQWFHLGRHGTWVNRFELRPAGAAGTEVRVRSDTALTLAQRYARAAQQLVEACVPR